MSTVLRQMPQHVAHLPRTGHNMNQSFGFTASTGMILPVYYDQLNVGESVFINSKLFARTQPLVVPAMADVDFYLNWFFVPIPMLYQLFPSIRYQTNDYYSSVFHSEIDQYGLTLPLCNIDSITGDVFSSGDVLYVDNGDDVYNVGGLSGRFDCVGKSTFRLLNHLGFNPYGIFKGNQASPYSLYQNPTVFPLFPLAYQAIFQDYFRIDDVEKRNPLCCNSDRFYDWNNVSHDFLIGDGLFQLRYRPRHKDYFTSVKVSPLTSAVNLLPSDNVNVSEVLSQVDNWLSNRGAQPAQSNSNVASFGGGSNIGTSVATQVRTRNDSVVDSTGDYRSLFAVEKLLRIVGRAKKDYDSQILAHFGYKVPHDVKHQLSHLFEMHGLMHIGEVASTSDTYNPETDTGLSLGSLSGKGYISIDGLKEDYKFTAPVDGVLMCTFSAVPRFRYYDTFDKLNAITTRLDFFTPEFDKLGMQPLFAYEAGLSKIGNSTRIGWQYRYSQHKMKYDRVTEAFKTANNDTNFYSAWVLAHDSFFGLTPSAGGYTYPALDSFYCSPHDIDNIMLMKYDSSWSDTYEISPWLMFGTDPFICDFTAMIKKVSIMSPTGEPDL